MTALRRAASTFVLAVTLGAASCTPFTSALWGVDEDDRRLVVVEERSREIAAEVAVAEMEPVGLLLRDPASGSGSVHQVLRPIDRTGLALALVAGQGGLEVQRIEVHQARRIVDGRIVADDADVELALRIEPAAMVVAVETAMISEAARAAMAPMADNAFAPAVTAHLPPDLALCVDALRTLDLAAFVAAPQGAVRAEAFVFAAEDGSPRFHPTDASGPPPIAEAWSARRERLSGHTLFVRVVDAAGTSFVRIRPDLLFWWAATEGDGPTRLHHS
ncbi:MAG: hypothetical protein JNK15_15725, partial [Planctomycetes bacterium]|nr:hypothetical protein [Planctomycetota bacterium]